MNKRVSRLVRILRLASGLSHFDWQADSDSIVTRFNEINWKNVSEQDEDFLFALVKDQGTPRWIIDRLASFMLRVYWLTPGWGVATMVTLIQDLLRRGVSGDYYHKLQQRIKDLMGDVDVPNVVMPKYPAQYLKNKFERSVSQETVDRLNRLYRMSRILKLARSPWDINDQTLGQLLEMEAESLNAVDTDDLEVTPELEAWNSKWTGAVRGQLEEYFIHHPPKNEWDPEYMADTCMNEGASFDVLMTVAGHGVGIWDGRWSHLLERDELEGLVAHLKRELSSLYYEFEALMSNIVYDQLAILPEDGEMDADTLQELYDKPSVDPDMVERLNRLYRMSRLAQYDFLGDDEEPEDMPSATGIKPLIPRMIQEAQRLYDEWDQNEEGYSELLGYGGICHEIAGEIASILADSGYEATTVSSDHENHVWVAVKTKEGVYEVDIPYQIYEAGSWYNFKKIPGVKLEPSHVVVDKISGDPNDFRNYTEEY